jgi:GNAT superfamily N-acetyltransferase
MNIFPITTTSPYYTAVEFLLKRVFPESERRNLELQRKYADEHPNFTVYAACNGDRLVGFFTLWTFEEFSFVEHFAVIPVLQGRGYGTRILQYIKEIAKTPLLLEIEVPFSEEQEARKHFYEKNGFEKLDKFYYQPPYTEGGICIVMHLMKYGKIVADSCVESDVKLYSYVKQIYAEVYSFVFEGQNLNIEYKLE